MKLIIVNGFDRSGSSFIGGLLSRHPAINYFFQPFSSTEAHKAQYELWTDEPHPATEKFLNELQQGRIDHDFIASSWFARFSDYSLDDSARVGLIKETKLHTKIGWLRKRFPDIPVYGIWREPKAVLCSLVRNGFHEKWYGENAYRAVSRLIAELPGLEPFSKFLSWKMDAVEKMALVIAVRSECMAMHLGPEQWINYEQVCRDPDRYLNAFCREIGLPEHRFSDAAGKDFNVVGLPYPGIETWPHFFSFAHLRRIEPIFGAIHHACNAA
ncbi:MAG: sulfotransferase [Thiogranum sp.]|nr:sulfotransferase [Thiogranum sp.]